MVKRRGADATGDFGGGVGRRAGRADPCAARGPGAVGARGAALGHHEGHLVLHDGRLHIGDIASARTDRAGLAFLSACGTARNRLDLPDELSAFQLAGFSHLVGSRWPVTDRVNTRLVQAFYEHLTAQRDATVAESLHHAVSQVREREPERPSLWAPHLHIGP